MDQVKIDDIKDFDRAICCDTCKVSAIRTRSYAHDHAQMRIVMLYKLNARCLFFPELHVAVDGRRNNEVGVGRYLDEIDRITMHE